MRFLSAILLLALGALSAVTAVAALVSAILAWNAVETLAAIESIFGGLIAALLFSLLARYLLTAGKRKLKHSSDKTVLPESDSTGG